MELKFTPRIINEIEVENHNKPFTDLLGDIRQKNLALWVKKGAGLETEEEAFSLMEKYYEEGGDMESLIVLIAKSLQKGGFISKKQDLKKILKESGEKQNPKA